MGAAGRLFVGEGGGGARGLGDGWMGSILYHIPDLSLINGGGGICRMIRNEMK